jgi:cellulose synthase/poly-beta-1,6-N-acetylglucosamine synthase-like glycosyltransferase
MWGWHRFPESESTTHHNLTFSVIIPVRNEAGNVQELVRCLEKQSYPMLFFEVIFVNDHSTDGTYPKLVEIAEKSDLRLSILTLPEIKGTVSHKKAAITLGVENAKGDIILMTDGDVKMGKDWILGFADMFSRYESKLISGPVMMSGEGFIEEIQCIEFASLIGTSAALFYYNRPVMCNGANLAVRKDAFLEVSGYEGTHHMISGDDEYLMYKVYKRYPADVLFLKSFRSTVWIRPMSRFRDFLEQRIRWSGKWKKHINRNATFLAVYIFLVHVSFLFLLVSGLLKFIPYCTVIIIWVLKMIIEYIFFRQLFNFWKLKLKLLPIISCSLLYSIYAITFGILSNLRGYAWKGRQYKI